MSASLSLDAAFGGAPWLYHATSLAFHAAAAVLTLLAAQTLGLTSPRGNVGRAAVRGASSHLSGRQRDRVSLRIDDHGGVAVVGRAAPPRPRAGRGAGRAARRAEQGDGAGPRTAVRGRARALPRESVKHAKRPRNFRLLAAEAGALLLALALRFQFAPACRASFVPLSLGDALGTRLASLAKSNARLVLPFDLTVCDAFPVTSLVAAASSTRRRAAHRPRVLRVPSSRAGVAAAAGDAARARARTDHALVVAALSLPGARTGGDVGRGDRGTLGPMGVALSRRRSRCFSRAVSLFDGLSYRNDHSFWSREVAQAPACREAHFYLGEVARTAKRWPEAAREYERALAVKAACLELRRSLRCAPKLGCGPARAKESRPGARGISCRARTCEQRARHAALATQLATTELVAGNAEEAARLLEREVKRADALPAAILLRARAEAKLGRIERGHGARATSTARQEREAAMRRAASCRARGRKAAFHDPGSSKAGTSPGRAYDWFFFILSPLLAALLGWVVSALGLDRYRVSRARRPGRRARDRGRGACERGLHPCAPDHRRVPDPSQSRGLSQAPPSLHHHTDRAVSGLPRLALGVRLRECAQRVVGRLPLQPANLRVGTHLRSARGQRPQGRPSPRLPVQPRSLCRTGLGWRQLVGTFGQLQEIRSARRTLALANCGCGVGAERRAARAGGGGRGRAAGLVPVQLCRR